MQIRHTPRYALHNEALHRPARSMRSLQAARDQLPWFFKFTTIFASWLVLGAYVLAALIFTSASDNLVPTRRTLIALAATMLGVGDIAMAVMAFLSRSLLFQFHAVAIPTLTSSVLGLWAIVMNHSLHRRFPVAVTYIHVPLGFAASSTGLSIIYTSWLWYRLRMISKADHTNATDDRPAATWTKV